MPRAARVTIPRDLYQSRPFAELWYGARSAGERIRAIALERLYRNRPRAGGSHPNPREPAAFSSQAVLSVAASLVDLRISPTFPVPSAHPEYLDADVDEETVNTSPMPGS